MILQAALPASGSNCQTEFNDARNRGSGGRRTESNGSRNLEKGGIIEEGRTCKLSVTASTPGKTRTEGSDISARRCRTSSIMVFHQTREMANGDGFEPEYCAFVRDTSYND